MEEVKKGIYKHYKGQCYEVIGIAKHSETEETLVVYKALYETDFPHDMLWVRPLAMFKESVIMEGRSVPRFQYLSTSL